MPYPAVRLSDDDRLLIIRLGAVGDVLRTLPAIHLLRRTYSSLHLTWIVEDLSREVLEGHPDIDQIIPFPRKEIAAAARSPRRIAGLIRGLRKDLRLRQFTVTVDFQGSLKSGLLSLLSGAPSRIGFAPGHSRELSSLFANRWVRPPSRWMNRVERNLLMSEALGAAGDEVTMILPESTDERRRSRGIGGAPWSARLVRRARQRRWRAGVGR